MIGDILLSHAIDRIGLISIMHEFLDRPRKLDRLIFFCCRAGEIKTAIFMRAEYNPADRSIRPEVLGNRLIQYRVAHEEMSLRNLRQCLVIPRIAQNRKRRAIVLDRLTHAAPVDVLYLIDKICRNVNDH